MGWLKPFATCLLAFLSGGCRIAPVLVLQPSLLKWQALCKLEASRVH